MVRQDRLSARRNVFLAGVLACATAGAAPVIRIEKRAADFEHTTIRKAPIEKVRKDGYLTGTGDATYRLAVPQTGWYELYVAAAGWATDLFLDGELLIHTAFASGVWETGDKILNNGVWKASSTSRCSTRTASTWTGRSNTAWSTPANPNSRPNCERSWWRPSTPRPASRTLRGARPASSSPRWARTASPATSAGKAARPRPPGSPTR